MATVNDLARRMRLQASAVNTNSKELVKKVTLAVGYAIVDATPLDTSRARMNWQGSVGSPKSGVLAQYPSQPSSNQEGRTVAIQSITSAAGAYSGQQGGVWIVNNLDYITKLNNGWSAQAPANFVAIAVMAGAKAVSNVKLIT